MEKWAGNTLRVLGIIVASILMVVGSLFLLLLSFCSWSGGFEGGGGHLDQAIGYLIGLAVFMAIAIFVISRLAKGIAHNTDLEPMNAQAEGSIAVGELPIHTSPASERTIHFLIYAIVAGMALGVLHTFWTVHAYPITFYPYNRSVLPVSILSLLLYDAPYALLLVVLARKRDKRVFAYAFAIPTVLIIQTLYTLPLTMSVYSRGPLSFVFISMALAMDCLILWFAWQANQHVGYRHEASSLLAAGVVVFLYFSALRHLAVPLLYRFWWR